jgi:hypothetical protein
MTEPPAALELLLLAIETGVLVNVLLAPVVLVVIG